MLDWLGYGVILLAGAVLYAIGYEVTKGIIEDIRAKGASGLREKGTNLSGTWYAVWQTTVEGKENVNIEVLEIKQKGRKITMENVQKSPENTLGGYLWRGECKIFDNEHILGHYLPREANVSSKGTIYFLLNRSGNFMTGKWVGCNYDYGFTWGFGVIAKDRDFALDTLRGLLESGQVTRG
jgi:hypothetical protein